VKAEQFGNRAEYLQAWILHNTRRLNQPVLSGPMDSSRGTSQAVDENIKIDLKIHWNAVSGNRCLGSAPPRATAARVGDPRAEFGQAAVRGVGAADSKHLSPISENRP
jgi:hypothetical protein